MSDHIDIRGIDKAAVLAALHNGTRAMGMGIVHDIRRDMTVAEAQAIIDRRTDDMGFEREKYHRDNLNFGYVCGRPVKANISGDSFDPWAYDRDAGQGAAKRVIDALRSSSQSAA